MKRLISLTTAVMLAALIGSGCVGTQTLYFKASTDDIKVQAKTMKPALWKLSAKTSSPVFFPFPEDRLLVVLERDRAQAGLSAHDLNTGNLVWTRELSANAVDRLPMPVVVPDGFVHFYGGTEMLALRDGKTLWKRDDLRLGSNSPPAQLAAGSLYLIDESAMLHVIDANSGKGRMTASLDKGMAFTN